MFLSGKKSSSARLLAGRLQLLQSLLEHVRRSSRRSALLFPLGRAGARTLGRPSTGPIRLEIDRITHIAPLKPTVFANQMLMAGPLHGWNKNPAAQFMTTAAMICTHKGMAGAVMNHNAEHMGANLLPCNAAARLQALTPRKHICRHWHNSIRSWRRSFKS